MQVRSFDAHTFYEQESEQCIVLLPGLGYLFDRPLLRCARTLALQHGFCVLELSFGALPYDKAKMKDRSSAVCRWRCRGPKRCCL